MSGVAFFVCGTPSNHRGFALVDLGLLMSQPTDTREEFAGVFDFDQAFDREYPWCGAHAVS